jgi:hypothetical protein
MTEGKMKKIAPTLLLLAVFAAWPTTLSAGEDLDRLDMEASYCQGSVLFMLKYWQAETKHPDIKMIEMFQKDLINITQYLEARGKVNANNTATMEGFLDMKTCKQALDRDSTQCFADCGGPCEGDACVTPQYTQCLTTNPQCRMSSFDSAECKKATPCLKISERLPM